MRILIPLLLLIALAAPATARAASVHEIVVSKCKTGPRAGDRFATFKATIRSVSGTAHMAVRFKLLARTAGSGSGPGSGSGSSQSVAGSKFAVWHRSHSGVARYVYSQTVKRLKPGTAYRMRVKFRWYDADGNVIKQATRVSPACVQDGPRPNLRVSAVSAFPGPAPGTAIYAVSVANPGGGPADSFTIALFVDGALADSRTIDGLEPGESATIDLNGPSCRRMSAVADSEGAVAETNEDDNALVSSC